MRLLNYPHAQNYRGKSKCPKFLEGETGHTAIRKRKRKNGDIVLWCKSCRIIFIKPSVKSGDFTEFEEFF